VQAPVLFTLAEDLKKMELHVAVDEADIGSVEVARMLRSRRRVSESPIPREDQRESISLRTTRRKAAAAVAEQRLRGSATSTGVVTYETVLDVDNSDLLLRPGMTANGRNRDHELQGATLVAERSAALYADWAPTRPARRTRSSRAVRCRR
jgi:HlyD family secretion protein